MDKLMKLIQLEKLVCTMKRTTISHRLTGHLGNFFSQRSDTVEWVPGNVPEIEDIYLKRVGTFTRIYEAPISCLPNIFRRTA
jgi:hypothetical protein